MDVASSAERPSKLSVTGDRAKPVPSNSARVRTAAIDTADAAANTKHAASVRHAYIHLRTVGHKDVARISTLAFPASVNKADGAQQHVRSTESAASEILMRCDDHGTKWFCYHAIGY